jgi:hypothetical protein
MIETPDKLAKIALKRLRLCHDGAGREMALARSVKVEADFASLARP